MPGFPFIPPEPQSLTARLPAVALLNWRVVGAAAAVAAVLVAGLLASVPSRRSQAVLPLDQPSDPVALIEQTAPPAACTPVPALLTHGTRLRFHINPEQAARQARREGKLLFLLHLSGNFEDFRFT